MLTATTRPTRTADADQVQTCGAKGMTDRPSDVYGKADTKEALEQCCEILQWVTARLRERD